MFEKFNISNLIKKVRPRTKTDAIAEFFVKSKKFFIILAASGVVALVILFAFNIYQKFAQEKYSAIFHQALIEEEKGDVTTAKQELQKIYETSFAPSGVRALASLRYAGILLNSGSIDEALVVYKTVANSTRYDRYLRELSGLLASKILVIQNDANSDKVASQEALKQIEKFESYSKILRLYYFEQHGILEMKLGNLENAYKLFTQITQNPNGEQVIKMRAADMLKLLVAEGFVAK